MMNALQPLWKVLNNDMSKRDISSCIMFTNTIKIKYRLSSNYLNRYFKNTLQSMDAEFIRGYRNNYQIDLDQINESIHKAFKWCIRKANPMIFPLISKLLVCNLLSLPNVSRITSNNDNKQNFKNPACFAEGVDEYTDKLDMLQDSGSQWWCIKEAVQANDDLDADALESKLTEIEDKYEDKGIFDIEDENAKGPFVYELRISPFKIHIKELQDHEVQSLKQKKSWSDLDKVSNNNYIISFNNARNGVYDTFKNLKQMMHYESYFFVGIQNEIMHELDIESDGNDQFIQHGATILDDPMSDEKLIEYYKQQLIKQEIDGDNDEDNGNYCIQEENVFRLEQEPPKKKQRTSKPQSHSQHHQQQQRHEPTQPQIPAPKSFASIKSTPYQPVIYPSFQSSITAHISDISPPVRTLNEQSTSKKDHLLNAEQKPYHAIDDQQKPISAEKIKQIPNTSHTEKVEETASHQFTSSSSRNDHDAIIDDYVPTGHGRKRKRRGNVIPSSTSPKSSNNAIHATDSKSKSILMPTNRISTEPTDNKGAVELFPFNDTDSEPEFESKSEEQEEEEDEKDVTQAMDVDIPSAITIEDGVGWAYNVPIYNQKYYDMADFKIDDEFDTADFAKLVIAYACKSDLEIQKAGAMRQVNGRNRERIIYKKDEAEAQFVKGVPDDDYVEIFQSCFTRNKTEKMDIDLRKYQTAKQATKRGFGRKSRRQYITWQKNYHIKDDMKYTLYLLLRLYQKHILIGCINLNKYSPPWFKNIDASIASLLNGIDKIALDLTGLDDDEDIDDEMIEKWKKEHKNNGIDYSKVKVKREKMDIDEREYDSE